ncbi:site-2 protease family protein [Bacillus weihaiensis]|uniref:site-2 protease family protein n=1 Tax=Bacillus weihaiensis TaxID=1547283 RepID=UPI002357E4E1|nr:site-2 protease family protein [Bacillus weihaiensis]
MDYVYNLLIYLFILFPIVAIIHEFGHAFFALLFKQKIDEISIGMGNVIVKIGSFKIRSAYFAFGWVKLKERRMSKFQEFIFLMGGIIFNLITAVILDLVTEYEFLNFRNYLDSFIFLSYITGILNIIPFTTIHGDTDGKQILQLFKG